MNTRCAPLIATLTLACMTPRLAAQQVYDVDHVFQAAEVDVSPEILKMKPPAYPLALSGTGTTGMAAVAVTIDQMGDIEEIRVIKTSAPEFAKPAEECVRYWRFLPGNRNGRNVKVRIVVPIRFSDLPGAATTAVHR